MSVGHRLQFTKRFLMAPGGSHQESTSPEDCNCIQEIGLFLFEAFSWHARANHPRVVAYVDICIYVHVCGWIITFDQMFLLQYTISQLQDKKIDKKCEILKTCLFSILLLSVQNFMCPAKCPVCESLFQFFVTSILFQLRIIERNCAMKRSH